MIANLVSDIDSGILYTYEDDDIVEFSDLDNGDAIHNLDYHSQDLECIESIFDILQMIIDAINHILKNIPIIP